jgi:hypothetical protein
MSWLQSHTRLCHLRSQERYPFILLLILILSLIISSQPDTVSSQEAQHIALYLVVDSSGSMATSDPQNLRWTAVRLLASLLEDGDELVVLAFNSEVIPFLGPKGAYGPLIRIDRDVDKATLLADLTRFAANTQPNGYTDMLAAFKEVTRLQQQFRSDSRRYIIFLTDGVPDLPAGLPSGYETRLLQQAEQLEATLYAGNLWPAGSCQALNSAITESQVLLQRLVNTTPQGQTQCIDGARELPRFFLESFGQIADRHYETLAGNRFEVREDQADLIERLILIYLEDEVGCLNPDPTSLCVPIRNPSGRPLTRADIDSQVNLQATFDNDFIVLSIDDPVAGTWLVDTDLGQTHAIIQTRLRMEIAAPAAGISRQAMDQPLPVLVRFFQETEGGHQQSLPEGYTPIFRKQELQLIDPPDLTRTIPLDLVYNPEEDRYEDRTPPLDQEGTYRVSLETEVGGFRTVKEERIEVERFPSLKLEGLPKDGIALVEPEQPVEFKLVPYLDGQVEPITGLTAEQIKVTCDGQPVTVTLEAAGGDRYDLSFRPPQQEVSRCELLIEGVVKHIGTPYHLSFGPIVFGVQLILIPLPTPTVTPTPEKSTDPEGSEITGLDPSLIHDVEGGLYKLTEPFSALSDEEVRIDFTLTARQLPEEAILHVTITDKAGQPVPGVGSLLNNTLIPTDGPQPYQLRLQRTKGPDPWPSEWFKRRPVTFTVKLSTLLEVPILPGETFDVTGVRRSRLETWRLWFGENRQRLVGWGLLNMGGVVALWFASIMGWRFNRAQSRTEPLEAVTVIRLGPDGQILSSDSQALIQHYYAPRHRLFGVQLGSKNKPPRPEPFRLWPPESFWRWKLDTPEVDIGHEGDDAVVFELYAEPGSNEPEFDFDAEPDLDSLEEQYRLVNRAEEPLEISRDETSGRFRVESGAVQPLSSGNIILTGHNSRVQFGGPPSGYTPPPPTLPPTGTGGLTLRPPHSEGPSKPSGPWESLDSPSSPSQPGRKPSI